MKRQELQRSDCSCSIKGHNICRNGNKDLTQVNLHFIRSLLECTRKNWENPRKGPSKSTFYATSNKPVKIFQGIRLSVDPFRMLLKADLQTDAYLPNIRIETNDSGQRYIIAYFLYQLSVKNDVSDQNRCTNTTCHFLAIPQQFLKLNC